MSWRKGRSHNLFQKAVLTLFCMKPHCWFAYLERTSRNENHRLVHQQRYQYFFCKAWATSCCTPQGLWIKWSTPLSHFPTFDTLPWQSYLPMHTHKLPCKCPACEHQEQRRVQCLVQGHFDTWQDGNWTCNLQIRDQLLHCFPQHNSLILNSCSGMLPYQN